MATHAERPATPWDVRDLPLLRVAAQHLDASGRTFDADQVADEAGLSEQDAKLAGRALIDRGYLIGDYRKASASFDLAMVFFTGVTEKGARAAGLWPSEQSVEAFQAALLEVADRTPDPEQASFFRRVAGFVGGMSRDVAVDFTAAFAAKMAGM